MVYLQAFVGEALLSAWNGSKTYANLELYAQEMPYPKYYTDGMLLVIQAQLPLFIMLSYVLSVIQITKSIVYEKERKIKVIFLSHIFYLFIQLDNRAMEYYEFKENLGQLHLFNYCLV